MTFQTAIGSWTPLIYLVIPNTWTWTWTWPVMIPINLVFQWRLIFDKKLKKLHYLVIWLETLTLKNSGRSVSTNNEQLILVPGWSGRWWRLKRSSTNWSLSKWSWNWFRCNPSPQTSGFQPDFVSRLLVRELRNSARLLCRDSFQLREILSFSSINWSRLLS